MISAKFELLFENHFRSAVFISEMIVSSRQVAEDIVQDVFIRMLDVDIDSLVSPTRYLYISVRNASVDYVRSRVIRVSDHILDGNIPDNSDYDLTPKEIEYAENVRKLYMAIEKLPDRAREILKLVCFENCSYKEAAEKLGVSVATVKTHMYRAFKSLRKYTCFLMI